MFVIFGDFMYYIRNLYRFVFTALQHLHQSLKKIPNVRLLCQKLNIFLWLIPLVISFLPYSGQKETAEIFTKNKKKMMEIA